jgi:hypothetical protein
MAASRRTAFGAFGDIESVELLPTKAYGFVNFYAKESAVQAKEKLQVRAPLRQRERGEGMQGMRGVLMRE